jgi:septal ring factor EnvC (AmiA/AmiB activator)
MSDIDRTRMIPLHIADQAVAACDAEIAKLREENARLKAEVERLTLENSQYEEHHKYGQNVITSLREEVERLKEGNECLDQMHEKEMARSAFLCEQVDRLTKAVMHSPAAQLKLKELEDKTTFEEINPKETKPNA